MASSAKRISWASPLSRGFTTSSNHSSSTWCRVDVGQERTNRLPLPRPPVTHEKLSLIDDSYLDPLPYQAKHAAIADAFLDHHHELLSPDRIEVGSDV